MSRNSGDSDLDLELLYRGRLILCECGLKKKLQDCEETCGDEYLRVENVMGRFYTPSLKHPSEPPMPLTCLLEMTSPTASDRFVLSITYHLVNTHTHLLQPPSHASPSKAPHPHEHQHRPHPAIESNELEHLEPEGAHRRQEEDVLILISNQHLLARDAPSRRR